MTPENGSRFPENAVRGRMAEALIALGGNVGDARAILDQAVARFCDDDMVRLLARSSDYRTPPWGVEDQPPFINACLAVATALAPRDLLARAQEVERTFGRDRAKERRWGPRPLDIDLLAYDDVTLGGPDLILPHPHLFERAFVLVPLAEIAPDRRIAGVRVADALARVDAAGIERLPPRPGRPA
jgi:2-amino-4-hydroxy-6-hydroxymethyldihydropteridine diphosphokinase